jgi:hypothetical protein
LSTKLEFVVNAAAVVSPDDDAANATADTNTTTTSNVLAANVTSITWSIALDNAEIRRLGVQTYFFDTSMPLWIEVPSDITNEPTVAPTVSPSFEPTLVIMSKEDPTTDPGSNSGGGGGAAGSKWHCALAATVAFLSLVAWW